MAGRIPHLLKQRTTGGKVLSSIPALTRR
jgi:hypothetical protein